MKQLTQEQRDWRILGASGQVEYHKCRFFSQRFTDACYWYCFGIISGLILAVVTNEVLRAYA